MILSRLLPAYLPTVDPCFQMGQVIKQYAQRQVTSVTQRVVCRTRAGVERVLATVGGGSGINPAYRERLNGTFRSALVPLVRRGRAIAHKEGVLTAGMYLVGCTYNFCWPHESLRVAAPTGALQKWQERTPAMAAGLIDHCWSMAELLHHQIPLLAWVPPKRRGRPPKRVQPQAIVATA